MSHVFFIHSTCYVIRAYDPQFFSHKFHYDPPPFRYGSPLRLIFEWFSEKSN